MKHLSKRAAFGFILAIITAFSYNFVRDLIAAAAPSTPTLEGAYQADNVKTPETTPLFRFASTDPDNDSIVYEINWDTDSSFPAATSKVSDTDAGFANVTTPADTSPFNSGNTISYTVQSALTNDTTYFYRVRAKDPAGTNTWSSWSSIKSFTIDTSLNHNTWFQAHGDQFATNTMDGATVYNASNTDELEIDDADTVANWTASDATNTPATQETTIKQEGTGSVKIVNAGTTATTTLDLMEYSSDANAQAAYVTSAFQATGGTTYDSGIYRYHKFTSSGTFSVTNSGNVRAIVVGGGGGGADPGWYVTGGGGGAGGLAYSSSLSVSSNVSVTVGGGGAKATNGSNSTFSTLTGTGGGAGAAQSAGSAGGCGGGAGNYTGGGGAGSQGGDGGAGYSGGNASAGGGGGGMGGDGVDGVAYNGGEGGIGTSAYSSTLSIVGAGEMGGDSGAYYIAGGGAAGSGDSNQGGLGGGGNECAAGTDYTGGGGGGGLRAYGGGGDLTCNGQPGGDGIVIVSYPYLTLQSYTESTIKTQGTYSLKGVAKATNSLNKTLTRTIGSPVNLTDHETIVFNIRASRTGSNIKIGFHDSGGTTTEVTPNITSANTFQEVTVDLSGVSNANKDAIDQIIITIVNANSDNTFYIDGIQGFKIPSFNDTVTTTKSATDLSSYTELVFWVRSTVTGETMRFQFGESDSSEQTYDITINSANTWEQKIWDISDIPTASRNAVTKYAFKVTDAYNSLSFYFDDITASSTSVGSYGVGIAEQIEDADSVGNWASSDGTNTPISQETTIKQEGTGSVKITSSSSTTSSNTIDLMEYSSDAAAYAAYITNAFWATGGTVVVSGWYGYNTFTADGTFDINTNGNVEVVVVGGGGGGGNIGRYGGGGGGGAGGIAYSSSLAVSSDVSVDVGGGGAADASGQDSVFSSLTGTGGGRGGSSTTPSGSNGGGGGGAYASGTAGTGSPGYNGGTGFDSGNNTSGGGGGGMGAVGVNGASGNGGTGGSGVNTYSSWLSVVGEGDGGYLAGGGGGGDMSPCTNAGGAGGGGDAYTTGGTAGMANTGGGGPGGCRTGWDGISNYNDPAARAGGSGIVLVRYPIILQSLSEATIKTEGSYSLKVLASTSSLNKTLTKTFGTPINLSNDDNITFDIRSSRTGSNIKIGFHDSGGTTTEVTPNITSADTFQEVTVDLSGVSNANKDAIDQIIITIVNADSSNTFYIDDIKSYVSLSQNDTVTTTKSATDLSEYSQITFYVRSSITGQVLRFQFGESDSSEQTYDITINSANTWEQKTWDISGIDENARDAVTKYAFKLLTGNTSETFYFDDIWAESLSGTVISTAITAAEFYDATYWYEMTYTEEEGSDIDYQVVYSSGGTFYLIPDTDLPGNSSGFSSASPISLMNLVNKYPTVYLKATLTAGAVRPIMWDWGISTEFLPDPPSSLLVQDLPNPAGVNTVTPYFSAICNHPTSLNMDKYRVQVDDSQDFSSTVWDSGSSGTTMTDCSPGSRSQNITYDGDTLTLNGQRYYWRIKFWDEYGMEGFWSNSMDLFTMDSPVVTSTAAPFGCLIEDSPDDSYLKLIWEDKSSDETQFTIERNVNSGGFSSLYNSGENATYYVDSSISSGNTYQYRVRAEGGTTTEWCTTSMLDLSEGTFSLRGINMQGINAQ